MTTREKPLTVADIARIRAGHRKRNADRQAEGDAVLAEARVADRQVSSQSAKPTRAQISAHSPQTADPATGDSSAIADANARFHAVLTSDAYAGREEYAHALLANDKLTADEIKVALAAAPSASPVLLEAAEAAARAEMRAAIYETGNSGIEPHGGGKTGTKQAAKAAWDNVLSSMNKEPKP